MIHDICDITVEKAVRFRDNLSSVHLFDFIFDAKEEISGICGCLQDVRRDVFVLKEKALEALKMERDRLGATNEKIRELKGARDSVPPVLWLNTQEKDRYGNPIRKPVDNSAPIERYNAEIKKMDLAKGDSEKRISKYQSIVEQAERWIGQYTDALCTIQNLHSLDTVENELKQKLNEIQRTADRAIRAAENILEKQIRISPAKNEESIPLFR